MFIESLEKRCFFSVFNKDVIRLEKGKTYILEDTLYLRSNQKLIGDNKYPPILQLKEKGKSVIVIRPNVTHVQINGIRLNGYKNQPAIRVSGNSHVFSHVSATRTTGSVFIIENAEGVTVKDCNQENITQRGFIYANRVWNLVVRNVTTCGNIYENEMRFHRFDGLAIINCRIDANNPIAIKNGVVHKANALRVHDGKRAWINGLTVTGNVYFGVMDKDNGGLSDLKHGKIAEFKRKMSLHSEIIAENINIYGNLELGTNLKFKINNIGMVSWDRGTAITIHPDYGPFKNGFGLVRKQAQGIVTGAWIKYTNAPKKPMNLSSTIKFFNRGVEINNDGEMISWFNGEIQLKTVVFNKEVVK